jgi:acetyl-CoA carboxylase biotin carboxyl carrier protein
MAKRDKEPEGASSDPGADEIDAARVRKLAALLEETGLGEIEYATDQWRIRVARDGGATREAAPVPSAPSRPASEPDTKETIDARHPGAVTSPMVGTVYLSSGPDQPPFVALGDTVKAGQTLLIIEAMKVMNPLAAPRAGKIARITVENGAPVEFGAVLMIVE